MEGKTEIRSSLMLLAAAVIWGVAFVAQSVGMDYVGPFTFNAARSLLGGIVLIPCIFLLNGREKKTEKKEADKKAERRNLLLGGISCGICLCIASNLQQIGISYTTVGKAGFITAMYIIPVPLLGIFMKKRAGLRVFTCCA